MKNFFSSLGRWFLLGLISLFTAQVAWAQNSNAVGTSFRLPNAPSPSFVCYPTQNSALRNQRTQAALASGYVPFGYDITARGPLRILLVYAGFTNDFNPNAAGYNSGDWPQVDASHPTPGQTFPVNAGGGFYTSPAQFSASATDQTLSNFYYQMSQFSGNPLRMYATIFPKRINVTADDYTNSASGGGYITYTQRVLEQIKNDPDTRNFDFSQVDRRSGTPNFTFDNSVVQSDGQVDYVMVVWRNAGIPYQLTTGPYAGAGGFANVGYVNNVPSADGKLYTMSVGFTHTLGLSGVSPPLFAHEFAHTFYSCPHYLLANGVSGKYLYGSEGPGMMGYFRTFFAANAWERWFNGWITLQTGPNQANGDIQGPASLTATSGQFTLRDFITTGDAVRIRLPNSNQYLWLENHEGVSVFDNRIDFLQDGQNPSQPFRAAPRGLLAMLEDASDSRNTPLNYNNDQGVNGLKVLSAQGNFDYVPSANTSAYNGHLFGNQLYNFTTTANPYGGENQISRHRFDVNNDGTILWNPTQGNDNTPRNEWAFSVVRNNTLEDGFLGPDATFSTVGQKLGISYPTPVFPHQTYDNSAQKLSSIDLGGLSVELVGKNSAGDITIKVRYEDVALTQNTRWTGDLRVVPVPDADRGYALAVRAFVTLTVDKSGTPNRTTKTRAGDFINPTTLTLTNGTNTELGYGANLTIQGASTAVTMQSGSKLIAAPATTTRVKAGTLLDIQGGATLTALGQLTVESGGTLVLRNSATLSIGGQVTIQAGGYICTESGASLLVNNAGKFTMDPGALTGTNPALNLSGLNCTTPTPQCSPFTITGTYYCSTCADRSVKTLQNQNSVPSGTYYITLSPSSAIYQPWQFGDSGSQGAYNTNNNQTGVITLTNYAGCSVSVYASQSQGCPNSALSFRIFGNGSTSYAVSPNPAAEQFTVSEESDAIALSNNAARADVDQSSKRAGDVTFESKLYNAFGQLVRTAKSQEGHSVVDVRGLPAGIYTLRIQNPQTVVVKHIQVGTL